MVSLEGRVKVLDFGLARPAIQGATLGETQAPTVAAPISALGQVVGTVPYMAPEQIRGEAVDARTDLFSLGVVLYELLAGRRPFTGATSADVSSAILRDAPPPLSAVRADLPHDLGRIVGRCLEKDAARRVQTARDLRSELETLRRALDPGSSPASGAVHAPVTAPAREVPSIAVLPFANRSSDEEDEYFADGLADELLNVLAKIRGLRVAARSSSAQFKGRNEDLAVIGQKLNVATLLEGSVRKSGNRVRIAVQLVKVADGFHLWSETYDRTLDDIFAVQDDIAQSVVKELRTTLLGEEADSGASGEVKADVAAAAAGRGTDAEAHRLFLQGRFFVDRISHQDVGKGIALLKRALELDPGHALAWSCLAWAETLSGITGNAPIGPSIARAREAATRSIALAPDLPEAHVGLGSVQLWYEFDFKGADASYERALALAPANPVALRASGMLAFVLGRPEQALERCRLALELDPLSASTCGIVARVYRSLGRLTDAEEAFRRALEISPDSTSLRMLLSFVLESQGRHAEALAEALREGASWARLFALAVLHQAQGRRAESDAALAELLERHAHEAAYQIAVSHAVRGEVDSAFEWLEKSHIQRDSGLAFAGVEPLLGGLRADARWGLLMARLGLPG
jgi:serine/threonine-protein kinase